MQFKDKLKELRKQKNVSQEELAGIVYKSRSTVAKWETGLRLPDEESLELLAEYFGVEASELSAGEVAEPAAVCGADEAVNAAEDIKVMKKSLSRQKKIIIAICSVLGAAVVAWTVIVIIGLVAMFKPYYGNPAGESYYGIVEYSEEYGYNVNIPELGLCAIPAIEEDANGNSSSYMVREGDLIRIYFSYKNCPVAIAESYPARFMCEASSIGVYKRNVSLKQNEEGYLLTQEIDDSLSEFAVGDEIVLWYSEGVKGGNGGAVAMNVFCRAAVVEVTDGLITMQLPQIDDMKTFIVKLASGFFYESEWEELVLQCPYNGDSD